MPSLWRLAVPTTLRELGGCFLPTYPGRGLGRCFVSYVFHALITLPYLGSSIMVATLLTFSGLNTYHPCFRGLSFLI
jgi:hypothetical protein